MYEVYIGTMLCPIAPSKLTVKINSQNKTMNLINEGEVNILKQPGLTDVSFELLLPNVNYPFARYKSGFVNAKYFLDILEKLKTGKSTFQFKVIRTLPNGTILFNTNMTVSLEEYEMEESAKEGFDVKVNVKLKQFRGYGTRSVMVVGNTASTQTNRPAKETPATTYTVKSGDCLWNIAKEYYGNGADYNAIYNANKDLISNPNLIYPGQVLTIPGK